jgi:hypothetical protein
MGVRAGYFQGFRTIAGMVGVITAVLLGRLAGVLDAVAASRSLIVGVITGAVVASAVLGLLMRYQQKAQQRGGSGPPP